MKQLSTTREAVLQRLRLDLPYPTAVRSGAPVPLRVLCRGTADEDSDVDLLVELSRPLGFEFVSLVHYWERKLGAR